jgi:phosphoribosylanthranilate isomerase
MQVKICGIRRLEDAQAAISAGADMLGFNFYPPSPRYITPEVCREITLALRQEGKSTTLVGVFVNATAAEIHDTLDMCVLDQAQLHGTEPPEVLQSLGNKAFKALRPANQDDLEDTLEHYPTRSEAPAWLVDAYRVGEYGGTGLTANWTLAAGLAQQAPILLAGGLTPYTVAQAINQVHPWGVDVASGVESAPGVKDYEKIRLFIKEAKNYVA